MHTMPSQKACTDLPPMQSLQVFVVLSLIFIRFDHENCLFLLALALVFGTVTEIRLQKIKFPIRYPTVDVFSCKHMTIQIFAFGFNALHFSKTSPASTGEVLEA
jgi:hypothetical protein